MDSPRGRTFKPNKRGAFARSLAAQLDSQGNNLQLIDEVETGYCSRESAQLQRERERYERLEQAVQEKLRKENRRRVLAITEAERQQMEQLREQLGW